MLGRGLKQLREASEVSAATAAEAMEISPQTLWRMEIGQKTRIVKRVYVMALCHLYGASHEMTAALLTLAQGVKNPRWWYDCKDLVSDEIELLLGWEDHAQRVTTFHPDLIPPMAQTPGYRRALARAESSDLPRDEVDRMLEFLDHRHEHLLDRAPDTVDVRVILRETAVRDLPGGPQVRRDQLAHLVTLGEQPGVSIRIVPQHAGIHPGLLVGAFDLLEFPEHPIPELTEPPVVHLPRLTSTHYLDHHTDITTYRTAVNEIHHVALDEDASAKLLLDIAADKHGHS
ncbi:helix-turn-helix domain-containing protein [Nocardia alni]|uniref:helix-turn-helix domain-containing protein n=1 Tax=Nocardia alni TaxID=2815723 RepID=UPI001C22C6B1|nr:helix-turn-helix transcriptional regulator [Nocardia alni]